MNKDDKTAMGVPIYSEEEATRELMRLADLGCRSLLKKSLEEAAYILSAAGSPGFSPETIAAFADMGMLIDVAGRASHETKLLTEGKP